MTSCCSGAAPKERASWPGGAGAYSVVRCQGLRLAARMSASMRSGGSSCPCCAPAGRALRLMTALQMAMQRPVLPAHTQP